MIRCHHSRSFGLHKNSIRHRRGSKQLLRSATPMPVLSALDLIESRGLPRQISFLSEVEAETLDCCEQIEQQCTMTRRWSYRRNSIISTASNPRRNSECITSATSNSEAWANAISAMRELRRMSLNQPAIVLVQKLGSVNYTTGGHFFPDGVFLNGPNQTRGQNKLDCTTCGMSMNVCKGGEGGRGS